MVITVELIEINEVATRVGTSVSFIRELAAAELVSLEPNPGGLDSISAADADRVRVAALLAEELDVNLAGLEVILHMRETMVSMQRQFGEVLRALSHHGGPLSR